MMGFKDLSVILTAAMPPAPIEEKPVPARSIKGAIANLERETELLMLEARGCSTFNETIQEMAERLR